MKKLLIAAVMCLLVSVNVLAEAPEKFISGDYEYFLLEDGTVKILGYDGEDEEIDVPEQIDGHEVTSIRHVAFSFCKNFRSIKLPESINNIEGNPFKSCKSTSLLISPDHPYLAVIDGALFSKPDKRLIYCPDTKEDYAVPDGIEVIGNSAFYDCDSLNSIILPDSVMKIEGYAFSRCDNLNNITLPENITSIGNGAFDECERLESINLPESIDDVGDNPFSKCDNVRFILSPDHPYLSAIDGVLFCKPDKRLIYCPNTMERYVVPDGIQTIGAKAFADCDNLSSITLPDSVTSIGDYAFVGRKNLTITVPRDSYAAEYCEENGLNYTYPDANDWLKN